MPGINRHSIVIQKRDRHLLEELATMRVFDRDQAKIVGRFGSTPRANARLLALVRAGLLRRFFLGVDEGNRKSLYSLSAKGAALVSVIPRGPRRANNALLVADFFVMHQLTVNEIYCELKYGPVTPGISFGRWVSFNEYLSESLRLIPDGYVELQGPMGALTAFLEIDLGHERLAVWKKKVESYIQYALSGQYTTSFGHRHFRVLVIVSSERRLLSIRRLVRSSTQKVFWFTTVNAIRSSGFFERIWSRPEGNGHQSLFKNQLPTS